MSDLRSELQTLYAQRSSILIRMADLQDNILPEGAELETYKQDLFDRLRRIEKLIHLIEESSASSESLTPKPSFKR